jgi:dihydroorotase (multifunctional complex type)
MYDLGIEGGTLVTGQGRRQAHLYVEGGTIAAIGDERHPARQRIDATGLHVLPGMIDGHVHFQDPGDSSREDFISGSSAAAVGGITALIEHTHSDPVRSVGFFRDKAEHLRNRSVVDFGLAAHVWPEDLLGIGDLWRAGVLFFKLFTCTTHGVPALLPGPLLAVFRQLAACDGLALVHCEDESLTAEAERVLHAAGRQDFGILPLWRNREAEQVAVSTTALLASLSGARVGIAHTSQPAVIEMAARERRRGARLWVECCPQYLYLREDEIQTHGPFRKFTPPARSEQEAQGLWEALANGAITHISTDHAPSTRAQKEEGLHDMWQCHFGLPGVQTTLTMLLEGVNGGRLTLERVVQLTSETPARLYRLGPRKGSLAPGADADLVLVDLGQAHEIRDEAMLSKAGWTPYGGRRVRGRPALTLVRGQVIARDGRVTAPPGTGRLLLGPGAAA